MMPKLILGPTVTGLTSTQATFWGRADGPAVLHAWLGSQLDLCDAYLAGTAILEEVDGFAGRIRVEHLAPETRYHYTLTLSDSPPDPNNGPYPTFTTFPPPGEQRSFSFVFGSCFRPANHQSGEIFDQIDELRQKFADDPPNALRFALMIGDQIYADICGCNGLDHRAAVDLQDYRAVYAYNWSRPPLKNLLAQIPTFMILDDHEVDDDWTWKDQTRLQAQIPWWDQIDRFFKGRPKEEYTITKQRVQDALKAYQEHQGQHIDTYIDPLDVVDGRYPLDLEDQGSFAYTFEYGAVAFFVLDTRTRRIKAPFSKRLLLSEGQWQALENWLLQVKDSHPVKFIITSCALLFQMWIDIPRDRWNGFPGERKRLLKFLAEHEIEGVHLLAGDLHSSHAVSADLRSPSGRSVRLWEFCASPFEQKPNWMVRYTYVPILTRWLKNQKLLFVCTELNFGVVRVVFKENQPPEVCLETHQCNNATPNLLVAD
jgi:phosphodiesterase/alkaline phosphatase D-like protein